MNNFIIAFLILLIFNFSFGLPDDCNCRLGIESFVVNGKDSDLVPWQVSIQSESHMCSGIILDNESIISIQSCLSGYDPDDLSIVAGITRLDEASSNNTYLVKSIHFAKDSSTDPTNLVILKLKNKIDLEKGKIEKACIRMFDSNYKRFLFSQTFLVAGFGYNKTFEVDNDGKYGDLKPSNVLRKADVKIDYKKTTAHVVRTKPGWFVKPKSICVYDEGSSLMLQEKGKVIVIGLADDMIVSEIKRKPGKYKVCDGHSQFIKFSAINNFLTKFNTSNMCLEYKK